MTQFVTYAIGDVHGEADRLARLHERIFADIAGHGLPARVIHLGDLVDRGPNSRACINRAMALEDADDEVESITLMGNHEEMMLRAVLSWDEAVLARWRRNGGEETIVSYLDAAPHHVDNWRAAIDDAHVDWLSGLPTIFAVGDDVFVHAGIDPETFPLHDPATHMWTRSREFFEDDSWPDRGPVRGLRVIHGHTPREDGRPQVTRRRINVDTGAVYGGPLTAVVLAGDERPRFLTA
ncbi:MAG: serine/threonine protein phosphatase [Alphaproteobacteria bacterium]|nr:serine/threonine protein phosphatase [Alphaproteobacteria bacterium]